MKEREKVFFLKKKDRINKENLTERFRNYGKLTKGRLRNERKMRNERWRKKK